ncbi:MAG: peptidylprolyl isomerase [Patescibacteria group bacterium]
MSKRISITVLTAALLTFGGGCVESAAVTPAAPGDSELTQSDQDSPQMLTMDNEKTWAFPGQLPADQLENKQVRVTTAKGDIVFELLPDVAPITVSNFVYLTGGGYYDGLNFHRRDEGFVIQGGDPSGDGTGGPGYSIPAEFNSVKHERGIVAMARAMDPNSAGSQFYITLAPAYFLDNNYTVFGRVLEGMDVVDKIRIGDVMTQVVVEDKP